MLTGAVFLILLMAAANVAGLALARNAKRAREFSVRAALGASTSRIASQLLAESLVVAILAGVLSVLVAMACIGLTHAFGPGDIPRLTNVSLEPRAVAWALVLCFFVTVLVGLAPAIIMARREIRSGGGSLASRGVAGSVGTTTARKVLVLTEFALAILLLIGAGLLIRSLQSAESARLGFNPRGAISIPLMCPASWTAPQRSIFHARLIEEARTLPGVERAGIISNLFVGGVAEHMITAESSSALTQNVRFRSDEVSNDLFGALQSPMLRGRTFTSADGPGSTPVAVVNDVMARRLWPGEEALGKRFKIGGTESASAWRTVVGIVADMSRQGIEREPFAQIFEPLAQNPPRMAILIVRTSSNEPNSVLGQTREAVRRVSNLVSVYGATTLEQQLGSFLKQRRLQTSLLSLFAAAALLMATIGIYGLLQYTVTTRTQEIGVRMALGAQARDIVRLVIDEGLRLSLIGLVIGLGLSLWLARIGSSLLYRVSPADPATIISVSTLLITVATAACYFPARRATKIPPTVALRQ